MNSAPSPHRSFVDASGEACGTVTPVIKQALAPLRPGDVLEVVTHDPATREGVPAWCRLTGNELLGSQAEGDRQTRFLIRKSPVPPKLNEGEQHA